MALLGVELHAQDMGAADSRGEINPVSALTQFVFRVIADRVITVDEIETILSMGDRDKDGCLNEEGNYWKFQYLYQCSRWQPFTFGEDAKLPPF